MGDLKLRDWLDDVLEPFKQCAFVGSAGTGRSGALVGIGEGASGESSCNEEELREFGKGKDNPIKIFAHNVSFRLTIGASASPSWNFVRIDAPLSAALFNVNRTDTSTLIITLGSASTKEVIARREKERPKVKLVRTPSREMDDNQAALRIGAAVANANAAMVLPR
ncbi:MULTISPECIES: hypothetical protein [Methylosinus]|uniref:hypothetical protein n=1 Tax=Methylosinus TaxID=425 RepID=UPI000462EFED|nr:MULTISPECIES: hypothetical protein [Methylosinus]